MKTPKIEDLIGLFYTHEESSRLLGITRGTYTVNICRQGKTYHRYMRTLTSQLLKDIHSDYQDKPRGKQHYAALTQAISLAAKRSFEFGMGAGSTED